jgi:hypothetical protein
MGFKQDFIRITCRSEDILFWIRHDYPIPRVSCMRVWIRRALADVSTYSLYKENLTYL